MERPPITLLLLLVFFAAVAAPAQAAFETEIVDQEHAALKDPQVAFDGHGNAVAVWSSEVFPENRIRVARRPARGSFEEPQTISTGGYNQQPALAVDRRGNAVVVWRHADLTVESPEGRGVQVAYLRADGAAPVLQEFTEPDPFSPAAAMDSDGNALVAWSRVSFNPPQPTTSRIVAAFRPAGGTFGAPTVVSGASDQTREPQLAFDSRDTALAVWADGPLTPAGGSQIRFAARPPNGGFGPTQPISQGGGAFGPVIGVDGRRGAIVAWTHYADAARDVRAAFGSAAGFGPEQLISGGLQAERVALGVARTGEAVATFAEGDPMGVMWAARAPGQPFQAGQQLSSPGSQFAADSDTAISPAGRAVAAWREFGIVGSGTTELRAATRPPGGTFGELTTLHTEAGGERVEGWATAAARRGDVLVVWETFKNFDSTVQAAFSEAPNGPPNCSGARATPTRLHPANHRFRRIEVSVTDPDGDDVTVAASAVTQDEPLRGRDDRTAPDARLASQGARIYVRAERSQRGDGRVYRIAFEADDGHGGTCTGSVDVAVPRHRHSTAVDSRPPEYDSLGTSATSS